MKHIKKFENFYLNDQDIPENEDDGTEEMDDQRYLDRVKNNRLEEVSPNDGDCEDFDEDGKCDDSESPAPIRRRVWGDEVIERKSNKSDDKKKKKTEKENEKSKSNGLTAKQRKLPKALQDSILKRMKKK